MVEKILTFFIYFGAGAVGFIAVSALFAICKLPDRLFNIAYELAVIADILKREDGEQE